LALSGDIISRLPARHPLEEKAVRMIEDWLQECRQNHEGCRLFHSQSICIEAKTAVFPTRTIQIGQDGALCLKESRRHGEYVALSYCWGTSKHLRTTRTNIAALKEGFHESDLPQTFRDAIQVCRCLGIEYLWIDSLCIIQDDTEDWEKESESMGGIYQQAILTIAADDSRNPSEGILWERQLTESGVQLHTKCSNSDEIGSMIAYFPENHYLNGLLSSVLSKRGWCLQERVLSRRVLHFVKDQMIWECQKCCRSEDRRSCSEHWNLKACFSAASDGPQFALSGWYTCLQVYGQTKLTYMSDKLPAIAGIARRVADLTNHHEENDYLAGLWRHDLPCGLLWTTQPGHPASLAKPYRGPSWSWVSST
jgi:hypothetical protein